MTTPEPGQHVWIEAEISPLPGGWMIRPVTALGSPGTVSMSVQSMRQHPTDDPRQSLGHGTIADAFAGLDAMGEALRMAASPPQPTQDDPQTPNAADQATAPGDDPGATQGAGRDFVQEMLDVFADFAINAGPIVEQPRRIAKAIVAALGLHNLEQTAAAHALETAEVYRQALTRGLAERDSAESRVVEIRRETGHQQQIFETVVAKVRAERDAARRELQQLRAMVEEVAERIRTRPALDTAPYVYSWLHAALAQTAPESEETQ